MQVTYIIYQKKMIIPRIKYFAYRDYTDLNSKGRKGLRERISNFAKALKKFRKKGDFSPGGGGEFEGRIEGGGAIERIRTYRRHSYDPITNYRNVKNDIWESALDSAKDAGNRMKEVVMDESKYTKGVPTRLEYYKMTRENKALRKGLKNAGKVAVGVAGTAALAYGGKKLYDKYKKDHSSEKDTTKEFSETKEKVRNGLKYTSTGLGLGAGLGLGTAGYYGLKATKKGLDGISAYEGKTVKGLLKNKEVKEAADLIKRSFKNGDVRFKGNGKKVLNTAAGLAAASIVAGGASKLLGKNKDSKK